jgi:hypothetical protein
LYKIKLQNHKKKIIGLAIFVLLGVLTWQPWKTPPLTGDWQTHLAVPSTAEFNGNLVTIKNVRNFRYYPTESDLHPNYYDKVYDLNKIKKIWYITEPFNGEEYAAHTFLSFEFEDNVFVSITIEARKTKAQAYSTWQGLLKSYPLIYIAADERDTVMLRANLRKDTEYVYPVKTSKEKAQKLFVDMLERMNDLLVHPVWYNTLFSNCTTNIAYHINRVTPGRVSWSWRLWLTGYADEYAYNLGLLDTNLSLQDARAKYKINDRSEKAGDVPNYSLLIRGQ